MNDPQDGFDPFDDPHFVALETIELDATAGVPLGTESLRKRQRRLAEEAKSDSKIPVGHEAGGELPVAPQHSAHA